MERKIFLKACGLACLGGGYLLSAACSSARIVQGTLSASDLIVPITVFLVRPDKYRKYVVVDHEKLQYPVCVYRFSETRYCALLMRCTHQGTELQVFGDKLECPAHGSAFSNQGLVQNGPATENLRKFPVTLENERLLISLKSASG